MREAVLSYQFLYNDLIEAPPRFSLSPEDSDLSRNQMILNSLVATLVKYHNSGRIEPYLASEWTTNDDETEWSFRIRPGLKCEDGEIIDAPRFRQGLLRAFTRNLEKAGRSEFEKIEGWDDYVRSGMDESKLTGLVAEADLLRFRFRLPPDLLLNYLRMPYFGYWCESNFEGGRFRTDGSFASSGSYRLENLHIGQRAVLSLREGPFRQDASPKSVVIENVGISELRAGKSDLSSIVNIGSSLAPVEALRANFRVIETPPNQFSGLLLKPSSPIFKDLGNRQAFASRFQRWIEEERKTGQSRLLFSDGFYLTSPFPKSARPEGAYVIPKGRKVRIGFPAKPKWEDLQSFYERLFEKILGQEGVDYEMVYPKEGEVLPARILAADESIDIRVGSVYAGAAYSSSVVKMMFCSKLGVQFPDPSGRICGLVDQDLSPEDATEKLNRILQEDAAVFPVTHSADLIFVSKNIDFESIPKSFVYPRFEDVRFSE